MSRARATVALSAVILATLPHAALAFDVQGPGGGPPRGPQQGGPGGGPQLGGGPQQQQQQMQQRGNSIGGQMAGAAAKVSGWYRAYQGFVAAAAKVNQLISFGCGVWLLMSTPLSVVSTLISLKFTEAFMVLFLGLYGLLLLGVELPLSAVQNICRQYFFFVYTRPGRAVFVINVALIAWVCSSVSAHKLAHTKPALSRSKINGLC